VIGIESGVLEDQRPCPSRHWSSLSDRATPGRPDRRRSRERIDRIPARISMSIGLMWLNRGPDDGRGQGLFAHEPQPAEKRPFAPRETMRRGWPGAKVRAAPRPATPSPEPDRPHPTCCEGRLASRPRSLFVRRAPVFEQGSSTPQVKAPLPRRHAGQLKGLFARAAAASPTGRASTA